jgi:hypothetical protein
MRTLKGSLVIVVLGWVAGGQANVSDFSTGFDGWTQSSGVQWIGAGGNPGGYLQFTDTGPAQGGSIFAPSGFLGDWLSLYTASGMLSVDYKVFSAATIQPVPMWVKVTGSGGIVGKNLVGNFATPFDWTTMQIGLAQANWAVISGTWSGALSNVTELQIIMAAGTSADEITGIDNVILAVPEPRTAAAMLVALLPLLARRISERRKQS